MYVITFYSFKGGVGRTLSLVNVGIDMVRRGRKVLLVDFDLEAPGLDAFPLLIPRDATPGIVEFVTDYMRTNTAPDAREYVYRASAVMEDGAGSLWIMPSGRRDTGYSSRLQAIDWQRLYAENDGYLLFEDLKAQWEQHLKVDYVLVDSRTGHTDVGGICTRQLPDAVALCFLPNEENIRGLEMVAKEIRRESEGHSRKAIDVLFVPSNVPSLDDEDGILKRRLDEAERRLEFDRPACIIHRYDSLALLDNDIFALSRPKSRLASEYRSLAQAVTRNNLADRDVALRFLSGSRTQTHRITGISASLDSAMKSIRSLHARDGEVLHELASLARRLGREEEANALMEEAESEGFRSPEMMLEAASRLYVDGKHESALALIQQAIAHRNATYFDLNRAIRLLRAIGVERLEWLSESPAAQALRPGEQASLCGEMLTPRAALPVAERVLRQFLSRAAPPDRREFRNPLMLCLVGQRKFEEAMRTLGTDRPAPESLDMVDAFNYAMAEWGATRRMPADLFRRVTDLCPDLSLAMPDKNVCQCVAVAHWASENLDAAVRFLDRACELAVKDGSETFSGWRYLRVPPDQFVSDLESVREMIAGAPVLPAVFTASD